MSLRRDFERVEQQTLEKVLNVARLLFKRIRDV